jgi:cytoskeleton protein RodZ
MAHHPANPPPLSSAKVLKFGRLPPFPKFTLRVPPFPGGAGGLVASLAGAVLLFAGVSYMLTPGAEDAAKPADVAVSESPAPQPAASAEVPLDEPIVTAETAIKIGDEPMPDSQPAAAPDYTEDDLAGTGLDGLTALIQDKVPGTKAETTASIGQLAAAEEVSQTSDGREFSTGNEASRVTLKARAPVWIRIEDATGKVVLTQMLMKGDTYKVPDREGLVVIARDGGLLSYIIDGKEKGILGTPGEILVGRPLDVKSLGGNG